MSQKSYHGIFHATYNREVVGLERDGRLSIVRFMSARIFVDMFLEKIINGPFSRLVTEFPAEHHRVSCNGHFPGEENATCSACDV